MTWKKEMLLGRNKYIWKGIVSYMNSRWGPTGWWANLNESLWDYCGSGAQQVSAISLLGEGKPHSTHWTVTCAPCQETLPCSLSFSPWTHKVNVQQVILSLHKPRYSLKLFILNLSVANLAFNIWGKGRGGERRAGLKFWCDCGSKYPTLPFVFFCYPRVFQSTLLLREQGWNQPGEPSRLPLKTHQLNALLHWLLLK